MGSKKRKASLASDLAPRKTAVTHDWEKDDEELELEAALFGTSKKRSLVNGHGSGAEDDGMEDVDDDEVRYPRGQA